MEDEGLHRAFRSFLQLGRARRTKGTNFAPAEPQEAEAETLA